ncbi:MAG: hypothetical protein Q8P18_31940 [Pseudomonadota bacterium]|nr:hypothetical protein [Pseudomonadota bacterium]
MASIPEAAVYAFDPALAATSGNRVCAGASIEVAGRGAVVVPDEALSQTLDLSRARIGLGVASGPAWVRIRTSATRSADDDSYIGVAGEAWVPALDGAVVGATFAGFSGEVGIVPDPWVAAGSRAWGLDALVSTFAESLAWMPPSDAGLSLRWTGLGDRVDVVGVLSSGEGANHRERNEGKDLSGALSVAPLASSALVVTLYGRNGSRGLGYVRAHRVGARVAGELDRFAYGGEALLAWGIGDDALRAPIGGSAWVRARPLGPLLLAARGDTWTEDFGDPDAFAWRALGAAGVAVDVGAGTLYALAGADHTARGEAVSLFPGAPAGAAATTLYLHVGLELSARLELP